MRRITSLQNPKVKLVCKLHQKRYRYKFLKFIIDDPQLIVDGIKVNYIPEFVFVVEGRRSELLTELIQISGNLDLELIEVPERVMRKVSILEEPQGAVAVYPMRKLEDSLSSFLGHRPNNLLLLDSIRIPGNLGSIIRSAVAFNVKGVILHECVDIYNPKVIRSAREAWFLVNHYELRDLEELIELRREGYQFICLDVRGEVSLKEFRPDKQWLLIVGSETTGIKQALSKLCTVRLRIPINYIDSLNVSSATSIALFWFT